MSETIEKPKVTLIQGQDTRVQRVRVGDVEVQVLNAGVVIVGGKMAVAMTIIDAEIGTELADEQAPAA
ncbi:hypothetical protein [Methylobacterium dankookense]|uniref:Uncharacterized protein n=1 Tax=Methylobacterium dankookense TaxID=560405 RepID=A0A564G538_9HYPH|nr:hypothetical protein [Methylobacterium dankookense]GJD58679.1 hypothetical protein IFDJLNFL_4602 [Methylobacterium dankookense]VUF15192.1 hypothetical protein MTDSW087_04927 [Methylobacterium dankookense]